MKVEYVDGSSEEVDLPEKMHYELQKKIRRKMKVKGSFVGDTIQGSEVDATGILEMMREELVNYYLEPKGVDVEELTGETADKLLEKYYGQIQNMMGKKKGTK